MGMEGRREGYGQGWRSVNCYKGMNKTRKRLLHTVTYALPSTAQQAHVYRQARIVRSKRLSYIGAERVIRKDEPQAIVVRVEVASV